MGPHILHDLVEREAARHAVQLEKVLELVGGDDHAGARGEADDDRMRYEVDERAEPEKAHGQFDHADKEGERERQDHVMVRSGHRDGTERRGHDERSRHRRPRHQLPGRAEQRGHDCRDHAGVETVNRRHAGDGRVGDALREHHERAGQCRPEIGIQGVRVDMRRPAQKRQQAPLPGYCAVAMSHSPLCPYPSADRAIRTARITPHPVPLPNGRGDAFVNGCDGDVPSPIGRGLG